MAKTASGEVLGPISGVEAAVEPSEFSNLGAAVQSRRGQIWYDYMELPVLQGSTSYTAYAVPMSPYVVLC